MVHALLLQLREYVTSSFFIHCEHTVEQSVEFSVIIKANINHIWGYL